MGPSTPASEEPPDSSQTAADARADLPLAPRVPRRREPPTRRTAITVEAIVAAAMDVLDETGMSGLSMRRVAQRLGTGAASLYVHVSGKDELLELVFDELVGQVPLLAPDPSIWREQLVQMLTDLHAVLMSRRDAALAGLGRIPTTPKTLRGAEAMVAVMHAGGLTDRVVALGLDQLTLYVSAAAFEAGMLEHGPLTPAEIERYFADVHAFYARLPPDQFPVLASIAEDMTGPDGNERFVFGLEIIITGLELASARERELGTT